MKTASQRANRRRIRAASLTLCAVVTAYAGITEAGAGNQRFQIEARVVPQQMSQSGGGLDLQAAFADRSSLVGGGYSLTASAIASPYECASDTIFASGFDL